MRTPRQRLAHAVSWTRPTSTEIGVVLKSGLAAGLAWWIALTVTGVSDAVLASLTAIVVVQVSVRASTRMCWPGRGSASRARCSHLDAPTFVRDVDSVVDGLLSMSSSAPHLFGDRLDAFEQDARARCSALIRLPASSGTGPATPRSLSRTSPSDRLSCIDSARRRVNARWSGPAATATATTGTGTGTGRDGGVDQPGGRELARIASIWPRASDYARRVAERNRCSRVGDISVIINSSALPRRAKSSR